MNHDDQYTEYYKQRQNVAPKTLCVPRTVEEARAWLDKLSQYLTEIYVSASVERDCEALLALLDAARAEGRDEANREWRQAQREGAL